MIGLVLAVGVTTAATVLGSPMAGAVPHSPSWVHLVTPRSPGVRAGAAMAYDPATNQVVAFGGTSNGSTSTATTWLRTNGVWTKAHPATSPPGLATATMAWDAQTNQMLLFGGSTGIHVGDESTQTWLWTGSNWQLLAPAHSPPPSIGPVMADDVQTGQMILFVEGQDFSNSAQDTMWIWDGSNWSQFLPGPGQMPTVRWGGAQMAYDAATQQLLLFGGYSGVYNSHHVIVPVYLNDTWVWQTKKWVKLSPSVSPPAMAWSSMASDPVSGALILFGGFNGSVGKGRTLNQTWAWNGASWNRIMTPVSPGRRAFASATTDPSQGQLLLLGGYLKSTSTYLGDIWAFSG